MIELGCFHNGSSDLPVVYGLLGQAANIITWHHPLRVAEGPASAAKKSRP